MSDALDDNLLCREIATSYGRGILLLSIGIYTDATEQHISSAETTLSIGYRDCVGAAYHNVITVAMGLVTLDGLIEDAQCESARMRAALPPEPETAP